LKQSTFGERLAYARWWRAGVIRREGDADFAQRLGVTGGALSQWREREDPVDVEKCATIATLCEVPLDWLQRGERSPEAPPEFFTRFLSTYRDWVKRGGLKRQSGADPTIQTRRRSSDEEKNNAKRGKKAS
jgi:transcriptional regulator with XRE-family HTH domain